MQKTAYEMRISDWSSDVCSSDLPRDRRAFLLLHERAGLRPERRLARLPVDHERRALVALGNPHDPLKRDGIAAALDLDRQEVRGCSRPGIGAQNDIVDQPRRIDKAGDRKSTRLNSSH